MDFYILVGNTKQGPYPLEELKNKNITPHTLVWRSGLTEWVPASQLPELAELLSELPPDIPEASPRVMPKTWLVESILVTIFCCLPFGIVGIVYAAKVENFFMRKEYEMAQMYSKRAKNWTLWGFGIGLFGIMLYILLVATTALFPAFMGILS